MSHSRLHERQLILLFVDHALTQAGGSCSDRRWTMLGHVMKALVSVRQGAAWLLGGSLLTAGLLGCGGDDEPKTAGMAGSSGVGGGAAGSATTAGTTGTAGSSTSAGATGTAGKTGTAGATGTAGTSSGGGDLASLCSPVCTKYYQACPIDNADGCPARCATLIEHTPAGCSSLQSDYLSCLANKTPQCGTGSWAQGYEAECDGKGRGLCIKTGGAECIAGEDYDNVLCETFKEGKFGYYCQKNVAPKPGCKVSTQTTREGLHCCEAQLTL